MYMPMWSVNLSLSSRFSRGIKVPRLLHRFVGVTRSSISTDALLRDIVDVHSVRLCRRVRKDPLLSSAKDRLGVDSVGIEPLPIDRPVACCLIKAPVTRHGGFSDIWQRAERWRNRAVIDEMLSNAKLKQWRTRQQIREIDVLS